MKKRKRRRSKQRPIQRKATTHLARRSSVGRPSTVSKIDLGPFRAILLVFGGLGAALTVFSSFQTLLDLADWAAFVVEHWNWLLISVWTVVFKNLGLTLNPLLVAPLTFVLSMQFIAFSALALEQTREKAIRKDRLSKFFRLMMGLAVANVAMFFVYSLLLLHQHSYLPASLWSSLGWNELLMGGLGFFNLLALSAHKKSWRTLGENALIATLIGVFYFLVALPSFEHELSKEGGDPPEFLRLFVGVSFSFYALQMMVWLSWASPKFVLFRLYIVLAIVLSFVGLNFLSKLQFSIVAPL